MNRVPIAPFSQFLSYYCGPGKICYIVECQLIFLSGICWPGLPLQRFLPGADYASLESLLKNMTRLACRTTPSPPVKFKGNETYLNASEFYSTMSFYSMFVHCTANSSLEPRIPNEHKFGRL